MDKKTGKVIKDADGKAVTSEAEITPETADGKVDVDFIFDGSNLAGKTIVMFEEIRYEDKLVGVHADINDEAQTIYVPAIATEALDEVTGIHLSNAGDDVKVKDTVTYKNLIPGLTYRVAGTVMDKDTKSHCRMAARISRPRLYSHLRQQMALWMLSLHSVQRNLPERQWCCLRSFI